MSKEVALIDMDIVAYTVSAACEGKYWIYKGEEWASKKELNKVLKKDGTYDSQESVVEEGRNPEPWEKCKGSLVKYVEEILELFDDYKGYLSGKGNFRYKVATIQPYKGNRTSVVKPHHLDNCRQLLVDTYGSDVSIGYEADDSIGLESGIPGAVSVSTDKDLDCIPGNHYNWVRGEYYSIDEMESYRSFFKQLFLGDNSDNILGLYGVGPKAQMIKDLKDMETVEEMKDKAYLEYNRRFGSYGERFLEENAKLLWILQPRSNPIVSGDYWNG